MRGLLLPALLLNSLEFLLGSPCGTRYMTFNAFLVPGFDYENRLDNLAKTLASDDADIVCLQEVWLEKDIRKIVSSVEDNYQYSWSFLHQFDGKMTSSDQFPSNTCTVKDMYYYMDCVKERCIHHHSLNDVDSNSVITCILQHCNPAMYLGDRCFECSVIGCFNPSNIARSLECQANLTQPQSGLCETLSPEIRHRTSGLLLLSKRPLSDLRRHMFYKTNSLFSRGYLSAKTEHGDNVVCTQLTSNMGAYYYDIVSGFSSYREQNEFELRQLLASFAREPNAVIMGDLGTSPSLPSYHISSLFSHNFDEIENFGFQSVVLRLGHCTFCSDNPLNEKHGHQQSTIQDHILIQRRRKVKIDEIRIKYECTPTPLSDHYAVQISLGGNIHDLGGV